MVRLAYPQIRMFKKSLNSNILEKVILCVPRTELIENSFKEELSKQLYETFVFLLALKVNVLIVIHYWSY